MTISGDMALRIVSPAEGKVLRRRESEVVVEGDVDPFVDLPAAFEGARPELDVNSVVIQIDGSPPQQAALVDGHFTGTLRLAEGEHRVRVVATRPISAARSRAKGAATRITRLSWPVLSSGAGMSVLSASPT